jgi:hypothetical protein
MLIPMNEPVDKIGKQLLEPDTDFTVGRIS